MAASTTIARERRSGTMRHGRLGVVTGVGPDAGVGERTRAGAADQRGPSGDGSAGHGRAEADDRSCSRRPSVSASRLTSGSMRCRILGRKSSSAKRARSCSAARIVSASTPRNATAQRARYSSTGKTLPCCTRRKTSMPRRPGRAPWTRPSRILSRTSTCAYRWPRC